MGGIAVACLSNSCVEMVDTHEPLPLLDTQVVDSFYSSLFEKYNLNGSLLLQRGHIFHRVSLDQDEAEKVRMFLINQNLASHAFRVDTSHRDPLPRISFSEIEREASDKLKDQKEMEAILIQIEEEKLALLRLSDRVLPEHRDGFRFLFQFQIDKQANRYLMRYNIQDPVVQILYHVNRADTARQLWIQLRDMRQLLDKSVSK